ncbi:MAG: VOC family protein [Candidatus Eremiobacteraeota bacterium]|nr:VOC family protein [Candidatus Eremiobacteraeota bacterium]MBV8223372.1 VOC family protein [Candidatus Eremiobacteraeota bacterium]
MATAGATKVKGMDASYYTVKDMARATKFYNELLGMEPTTTFGESVVEYTFPSGETFGLFQSENHAPRGGILFAVDDLHKAVAEHKTRGVKFRNDGDVMDSPVCHMAFGEDSEGNDFILHQRK